MEPIILASASPRREEYFKLLGLPYTRIASLAEESYTSGMEPRAIVEEIAQRKVRSVLETHKDTLLPWVFAADTLIALEGKIYGKPKDRDEAREMLQFFRGKTQEVISAIALYCPRTKTIDKRSVVSSLTFGAMLPGEIEWYLDTGEWQGVAGAYKVQGLASCFITEIKGSYSSIVGLPLREFYAMLRDNGYPFGG